MKTLYKLAQELGIKYATVYKRFKNSGLINQVEKDESGKLLINAETERIVSEWYTKPTSNQVNQPDTKVDVNQSTEITKLQAKIESLEAELKEEREHSRIQSNEITNFAKQFAELTKNNQLLLGIEQVKTAPKLIEADAKKGFWSFLNFKKNKIST